MKLLDILTEDTEDIKKKLKKTMVFSLPSNEDNVAIDAIPSLLNIMRNDGTITIDLYVSLFLGGDNIYEGVFPEIMHGVTEIIYKRKINELINPNNIKLRFKEITLHKDQMRVDLFKYIKPELRDHIRRPIYMFSITDTPELNQWISPNVVLPEIDSDYNREQINQESRAKNMYRAFRRGRVNGVSYELGDMIKLLVSPDYNKIDFSHNIIKPHFDIVIHAPAPVTPEGHDEYDTIVSLREKFKNLGIKIYFKD